MKGMSWSRMQSGGPLLLHGPSGTSQAEWQSWHVWSTQPWSSQEHWQLSWQRSQSPPSPLICASSAHISGTLSLISASSASSQARGVELVAAEVLHHALLVLGHHEGHELVQNAGRGGTLPSHGPSGTSQAEWQSWHAWSPQPWSSQEHWQLSWHKAHWSPPPGSSCALTTAAVAKRKSAAAFIILLLELLLARSPTEEPPSQSLVKELHNTHTVRHNQDQDRQSRSRKAHVRLCVREYNRASLFLTLTRSRV